MRSVTGIPPYWAWLEWRIIALIDYFERLMEAKDDVDKAARVMDEALFLADLYRETHERAPKDLDAPAIIDHIIFKHAKARGEIKLTQDGTDRFLQHNYMLHTSAIGGT